VKFPDESRHLRTRDNNRPITATDYSDHNHNHSTKNTGQVLPSAKYRPTRVVVDAALRRIGKSRHDGHKIANISGNCERV